MSVSIFEKLLGSYSGMRKRTWSPTVIESTEEGQVISWKGKLASKATDNATKKSEYENAKTNLGAVGAQAPDLRADDVIKLQLTSSKQYGECILGNGRVWISQPYAAKTPVMQVGAAKTGPVLAALDELIRGLGEEEADKSTTEKAGDKAVKDSDDKAAEEAPADEPVKFSEVEKETAETTFENLMGKDADWTQLMLLKIEKCINTPSLGTRLGKF